MTDPAKTKSLIVEGWRFIAHSYAIVNQWQLLALLRRGDIGVKVVDVPAYRKRWQPQYGLFDLADEQALRSLEPARPDERARATLRIAIPYDFSASRSDRTAVFGTSETQVLRMEQFREPAFFESLRKDGPPSDLRIVTPSRWSAEGYYKMRFRDDQVLIIPHGVDTNTFRPMPENRESVRAAFSISNDEFVFLSVGAMTGNKGIDLLLRAFAEVSRKFPHTRLILKGLDMLYQSDNLFIKNMETLSAKDQERVRSRTTYLGGSYSNAKMAQFYQIADAYVSPYRAEGFNLPVLEAAACGIPVICTRGGATDDFVSETFAQKIDSRKRQVQFKGEEVSRLEPDVDHLTYLMNSAIEDEQWRKRAAREGPRHVRANYTWDHIADLLVRGLFD